MPTAEELADAEKLAELARTKPPEIIVAAILKTMERHRIRGGIAALESMLESLPVRILELPDEQRKVIAAIVTVIEGFAARLQEKMKEL